MTSKFSSTSIETTLQAAISTSGATTMTVATGSGSALMGGVSLAPGNVDVFTVAIDVDTINEEIIFITNQTSDTMTIVRGQAGTSPTTHSAGAKVKHVLSSYDLTNFTTGIASSLSASIVTAKGDLIAASGNAAVDNLPVGTNGYVLTADSTETLGIKWAETVAPEVSDNPYNVSFMFMGA